MPIFGLKLNRLTDCQSGPMTVTTNFYDENLGRIFLEYVFTMQHRRLPLRCHFGCMKITNGWIWTSVLAHQALSHLEWCPSRVVIRVVPLPWSSTIFSWFDAFCLPFTVHLCWLYYLFFLLTVPDHAIMMGIITCMMWSLAHCWALW